MNRTAPPRLLPFCDTIINGQTCQQRAGQLEDADGKLTGWCDCRTAEPSGEQRRDEALAAAQAGNPNAMRAALLILSDAAKANEWVTANLVRAQLDAAGVTGPVVGAAFRQASKDGLLRRDGFVPSSQLSTHAHHVARWRSLIYATHGGAV